MGNIRRYVRHGVYFPNGRKTRLRIANRGLPTRKFLEKLHMRGVFRLDNKNGWQTVACQPSSALNLPLGRNHEATQNRTALGRRSAGHLLFSMRRLFFTEKTPETPLAAMNARVASPLFGATPSSVTWPFLTMM